MVLPRLTQQVTTAVARAPIQTARPDTGALVALGNQVQQIAFTEQDKLNRADAQRLVRQSRQEAEELWYGDDGGAFKNGQDYFAWEKTKPVDRWKGSVEMRLGELNSGARNAAERELLAIEEGFSNQIQRRHGAASADYYAGEHELEMQGLSDSTALAVADPARGMGALDFGLEAGALEIDEYVRMHGELIPISHTKFRKEQLKTYQSGLVAESIEQAISSGNDQLASDIMTKHGHRLSPDASVRARNDVKDATQSNTISRTVEDMLALNPIDPDPDAAAKVDFANQSKGPDEQPITHRSPEKQLVHNKREIRKFGEEEGWDADMIAEAVRSMERRGREIISDGDKITGEAYAGYHRQMDEGMTLEGARAIDPFGWRRLDSDQKAALNERADNNDARALADTDAKWMRLAKEMLHFQGPEGRTAFLKMTNLEKFRGKVTPDNLIKIANWADDIREGRSESMRVDSYIQGKIDDRIKSLRLEDEVGLFSSDRISEAERFDQAVSETLVSMQQALDGKRDLNDTEINETLARFSSPAGGVYDKRGRFVDTDVPFDQLTLQNVPDPSPGWIASVGGPTLVARGEDLTPENLRVAFLADLRLGARTSPEGELPPEQTRALERARRRGPQPEPLTPKWVVQPSRITGGGGRLSP